MLTIESIRNPRNNSGFSFVGSANAGVNGHGHIGNRWRAEKWIGKERWRGPVRRDPEEAAQDYCDYFNGLPELPATLILKTAGHEREVIERARNDERSKLLARLREIDDEENSASDHPGYVYLIRETHSCHNCGADEDRFKIGHARTSAQNRMIGLQTGNSRTFTLLATIEGSPEVERSLHAKYAKDNILQEWFYGTPELFEEFKLKGLDE